LSYSFKVNIKLYKSFNKLKSMLWNKKNTESALPDLPAPNLPFNQKLGNLPKKEDDEEDEPGNPDKQAIPAFPDSPMKKGFSQTAIKDAVSGYSFEKSTEIPKTEKNFKTIEMEDSPNPSYGAPSILVQTATNTSMPTPLLSAQIEQSPGTIPQLPILEQRASQKEEESEERFTKKYQKAADERKNDIFVRIDKFYSAKKSLEEIKNQIEQIDNSLRKIREVKLREEQELASWEKEIITAKSRIQEVNKNVFEKIE
jgi:hypothetical protein